MYSWYEDLLCSYLMSTGKKPGMHTPAKHIDNADLLCLTWGTRDSWAKLERTKDISVVSIEARMNRQCWFTSSDGKVSPQLQDLFWGKWKVKFDEWWNDDTSKNGTWPDTDWSDEMISMKQHIFYDAVELVKSKLKKIEKIRKTHFTPGKEQSIDNQWNSGSSARFNINRCRHLDDAWLGLETHRILYRSAKRQNPECLRLEHPCPFMCSGCLEILRSLGGWAQLKTICEEKNWERVKTRISLFSSIWKIADEFDYMYLNEWMSDQRKTALMKMNRKSNDNWQMQRQGYLVNYEYEIGTGIGKSIEKLHFLMKSYRDPFGQVGIMKLKERWPIV